MTILARTASALSGCLLAFTPSTHSTCAVNDIDPAEIDAQFAD